MPGRLKKKPEYNPELQFNNFLEELSNAYEETSSLRILATELNISPLKLRKLLITADVFTSDICAEINIRDLCIFQNRQYSFQRFPDAILKFRHSPICQDLLKCRQRVSGC